MTTTKKKCLIPKLFLSFPIQSSAFYPLQKEQSKDSVACVYGGVCFPFSAMDMVNVAVASHVTLPASGGISKHNHPFYPNPPLQLYVTFPSLTFASFDLV